MTKKRAWCPWKSRGNQRKLSEDQVRQIRVMIQAGVRYPDIARKFNCSESMVAGIKSGRRYFGVAPLEGDDGNTEP